MLHRDAGATSQESEVQDGGSQPQMPAEGVITWQGKKENSIVICKMGACQTVNGIILFHAPFLH